jgi:tetratricopeptide (TPR) repeat protein
LPPNSIRSTSWSNEIGRVCFFQRQFDEAIAAFKRALAVDPEDLDAHYNLMLAYQGAGDAENAERERRCIPGSRPTRKRKRSPVRIG